MRRAFILFFLVLLKTGGAFGALQSGINLSGCGVVFEDPSTSPDSYRDRVTQLSDSVKADTLLALARSQLGKNYCYAVSDPEKGFDCSGFVYFVFNSFNVRVPRSSKLYKNYGEKIPIDSAKAGDVIVFTGTNAKKRSPGHVGIVISCTDGVPTFIHSSSGKKKGVIISDFNESPYYKKRFIKIVRVAVVY